MKNSSPLLVFLLFAGITSAQDYKVTFSAYQIDTPTDQVDSVQIENTTQSKNITVNGDDTLHLVDIVQNIEQKETNDHLSVYPNPASGHSFVEFWSDNTGKAKIAVYDLAGRQILEQPTRLRQGLNTYKIAGLDQGNYVVSIENKNLRASANVTVTGSAGARPGIETVQNSATSESLQRKNTKAGTRVEWQYNEGDVLIFTAWGEGYSRIMVYQISDDTHLTIAFEDCVDVDGNKYTVVEINGTMWMAENLKTTKFSTNVPIEEITDSADWANAGSAAMCYYDNDPYFADSVGIYYNFYAAATGILCPNGWHVPTETEFEDLFVYLQNNGYNYDGSIDTDNDYTTNNLIAKSLCKGQLWYPSDVDGGPGNNDYPSYVNRSGLSLYGSGMRNSNAGTQGIFSVGSLWTATESNASKAYRITLTYPNPTPLLNSLNKTYGLSIRCIKD